MEARWLLTNRNNSTHLADPNFITSPTMFPILARSCPTEFDPEEENCRKELLNQNELDSSKIHNIRWLGHPKASDKSHGTLLLHSLTDNWSLCYSREA
ncbi:hypothetical protein O181_009776 [Austropuccinia psidii MF-1]|uniref:Uncharacterized protein n=1 Tax=Austropuccinia psidii MF-1 TaxID=1389203 RepID=A0A9Q3BSH5_9BASI|nr:hypothetical protein [Austropuccinia psidii MF-1]